MERITGSYYIETPLDPEAAAEVLAGEQSSGTFLPVPGETDELKQRFAARVESVRSAGTASGPSLPVPAISVPAPSTAVPASETLVPPPSIPVPPSEAARAKYHRAYVEVSWPVENFGYNLPVLLSTLQGNLYELRQFSGLKLMDIDLPPAFTRHFTGNRFGIEGSRRLTGVEGRPLVGTIIKPSIGLTPEETATLTGVLAKAGIDFIKDDELLSSSANSPFEKRVDAVMRVINDHADRTGKKVMYAFNISDETDEMLRKYEKIVSSGGTCAMISLNSVGLAGVKKICDQGQLALHGHRNGWGMLNRHPLLGIDFPAYQKIWRLAGIDQIHVNGIGNKFWEPDDSVVRSIRACLEPLPGGQRILPVVSSGQWGGQAPETYRRTGTVDLLYLAGGGIMAHPDGPAGGVVALKQAWEAAVNGLSVEEAAREYPEFARSVEKFGAVQGSNKNK